MPVQYMYLWEYIVAPGKADDFQQVYGPEGEWVRLFAGAPGYVRTELHRDTAEPTRFVTIDYWESESAWKEFRTRFSAEFEALDARCAALTLHEAEIGQFEPVGASHVAESGGHDRAIGALRDSRKILEGIFDAIPVRVFWKDRSLVYLGCNEAFAIDAGFCAPGDVIGKDDFQMGWHDQAELYREDDRRVLESGVPKLLIEEPQTTPDGRVITLLTSKVPLRDVNGAVSGVLGTYMDITHRKLVEEALERERARLKQALDDVKTLRGIVPICSKCKRVRDDEGFWNQVEKYVSDHSEAQFSHGICPACAKELYPEFAQDK